MKNLFNKTSLTFLVQFALILLVSFGIILTVDYFDGSDEKSLPAASLELEVE